MLAASAWQIQAAGGGVLRRACKNDWHPRLCSLQATSSASAWRSTGELHRPGARLVLSVCGRGSGPPACHKARQRGGRAGAMLTVQPLSDHPFILRCRLATNLVMYITDIMGGDPANAAIQVRHPSHRRCRSRSALQKSACVLPSAHLAMAGRRAVPPVAPSGCQMHATRLCADCARPRPAPRSACSKGRAT